MLRKWVAIAWLVGALGSLGLHAPRADKRLTLSWSNEMLTIAGDDIPGGAVKVWYIEAFCRPGSTNRDWHDTVIPHRTEFIDKESNEHKITLQSTLGDGVVVTHVIEAGADDVTFRVTAENPTGRESQAHWAQPCIRVDGFVGVEARQNSEAYLPQSFIFVDGKPAFMPTRPWATKAYYTPGQVWCPQHVDRDDVNPRPLSTIVPSNGLIGCVSKDKTRILATAWEPYQELFQGVIVCLHSDFRIGGLKPGEKKIIRGKIYIVPNDMTKLVERYQRDFPEHQRPR